MRKAIAFGLFVIAMLFGSALVVGGTVIETDAIVYLGMLMITLGIINLAIQVTVPTARPHVTLKVVEPKKVKKKTTVKRKTVKKKKPVKKKTTKRRK